MIYHVKSGSIVTTRIANTHKQAAINLLNEYEYDDEIGLFIIVDKNKINENNTKSQVFFSTQALIAERDCGMRLVCE